jgi:hypothetical protein
MKQLTRQPVPLYSFLVRCADMIENETNVLFPGFLAWRGSILMVFCGILNVTGESQGVWLPRVVLAPFLHIIWPRKDFHLSNGRPNRGNLLLSSLAIVGYVS